MDASAKEPIMNTQGAVTDSAVHTDLTAAVGAAGGFRFFAGTPNRCLWASTYVNLSLIRPE
jgi:hypothetical protein